MQATTIETPLLEAGGAGRQREVNTRRTEQILRGLTAGAVLDRVRLVLPQEMSLVTAARLLLEHGLRAAPVTDTLGRCVGVLSVANILRWAIDRRQAGEEEIAPPARVWCDWQVVDAKAMQRDEVRRHMTRDPLLVIPGQRLAEIAEALLDHHPRPVVVVDQERRPLGMVSSNDVLAALASGDHQPEEEPLVAAPAVRRGAHRQSFIRT